MDKNFILSPEEHNIAEKYLTKLEHSAASGKRKRSMLLFLLIFTFAYSIYLVSFAFKGLICDTSITEQLKRSEVPDGVLTKYWFVGEVRRTGSVLELYYRKRSLETIDCVLGILLLTFTICAGIFLCNHWNDYRRDALIAKILRAKYNDFKLTTKSHSP